MRIGELSEITRVSTRSLRYYEKQGLLHSQRRENGYRDFDPDSVNTVALIRDLIRAGLSTEVIQDILPCVRGDRPSADCSAIMDRVRQVRAELVSQEQRIVEHRTMLDRYLSGADTPGGLERLR